jgi:cytochrome c oxidase cbb3-type subunit 3
VKRRRGPEWWLALSLGLVAVACGRKGPAPSAEDGGRVFSALCARCHGADGSGGVVVAAGVPAPRNLRDAVFHSARTDDDLRYTISRGKGTAMPAFGAALEAREIDSLIAFIRTLDPRR